MEQRLKETFERVTDAAGHMLENGERSITLGLHPSGNELKNEAGGKKNPRPYTLRVQQTKR